eukprot:1160979-Pelagomonas_calceolata.AAC.11
MAGTVKFDTEQQKERGFLVEAVCPCGVIVVLVAVCNSSHPLQAVQCPVHSPPWDLQATPKAIPYDVALKQYPITLHQSVPKRAKKLIFACCDIKECTKNGLEASP